MTPDAIPIDFRSDTLTKPTDEMRRAMAEAEVGDDVFGEDPTIRRLEETAAARVGMEAGLFVPSGTMANQIAVMTHTERWGQVVCEENCHLALYEGGAASLLSGAMLRTVRGERGVFTPEQIERHFLPDDPHFAKTKLVALENTHNWGGGTVWRPEEVRAVADVAHTHGAGVHVDGARIFNAATALGVPVKRLTERADSVMFCLSKGLSAPVGSVLCGSAAFIARARYVRKALGGGMRQAGHLAAAGLVALDGMVDRLKEDHANARRLAENLQEMDAFEVDLGRVQTNMVYVDVAGTGLDAEGFGARMQDAGVLCLPRDKGTMVRFVTHRHVTRDDVDAALERVRAAIG